VLTPDDPTPGPDYELCAVMVHEGQNAHCGHYYDLIRDSSADQWYSYNDKVCFEFGATSKKIQNRKKKTLNNLMQKI
jgi:uncharacterized UBP type Zn finger protein